MTTFARLIGPVLHDSAGMGDGCYIVVSEKAGGLQYALDWHFAYMDTEPLDDLADWHVLAGFLRREAAEERRQKWLEHEGTHAVDKATFLAVVELRRLERYRTYKYAKNRAKKRAKRAELKRPPPAIQPGTN
jgi:hypothetical protein